MSSLRDRSESVLSLELDADQDQVPLRYFQAARSLPALTCPRSPAEVSRPSVVKKERSGRLRWIAVTGLVT